MMYMFALLAINLDIPPTFLYFFQSAASLASFLLCSFRFTFILVVESLLSPTYEHTQKSKYHVQHYLQQVANVKLIRDERWTCHRCQNADSAHYS